MFILMYLRKHNVCLEIKQLFLDINVLMHVINLPIIKITVEKIILLSLKT